MANFYDGEKNSKVSIDELISIFYDEAFFLTDDKDTAYAIARDALIDFVINNGDYAVA